MFSVNKNNPIKMTVLTTLAIKASSNMAIYQTPFQGQYWAGARCPRLFNVSVGYPAAAAVGISESTNSDERLDTAALNR